MVCFDSRYGISVEQRERAKTKKKHALITIISNERLQIRTLFEIILFNDNKLQVLGQIRSDPFSMAEESKMRMSCSDEENKHVK